MHHSDLHCRELALTHDREDGTDIDAWNTLLDQAAAKQAAQHVVIHSTPFHEDWDECTRPYHDARAQWEEGGGFEKAFRAAVDRVTELPNLNTVHIRFTSTCCGIESESNWWTYGECESRAGRMETLRTVFDALEKRAASPHNSVVRTLSIENLQNTPVPEFVHSDSFKKVVSNVEELDLSICVEYNEHGPDRDLYMEERRTFEPFLQREMLPTMARNLTSLNIKFDQEWGCLPGQFDGRGLAFPKLDTLVLENYVIGHHQQLDWILAQKSLKSLSLRNPRIVSHIRMDEIELEQWRLPTDDWQRWPQGAFGFQGDNDVVFTSSATWENVFDSIRTGLPHLVNFHLVDNSPSRRPEVINEISPLRYILFSSGILPSPWIEAENNSRFDFAEYMGEESEGAQAKIELAALDSADRYEMADKRALYDLLAAIKERQ
ncbi:hypothetical protein FZEAL_7579 [Fusarium zealandicum]|uniref:Uncharacterized protein n=1 Tax=Fusarium zealandicum TaxID=1053134 RepID=A0A8H4XIR4_9HYPO|nr:hypothetical protein FZEAL_7579 [Fusarium zealandicum]